MRASSSVCLARSTREINSRARDCDAVLVCVVRGGSGGPLLYILARDGCAVASDGLSRHRRSCTAHAAAAVAHACDDVQTPSQRQQHCGVTNNSAAGSAATRLGPYCLAKYKLSAIDSNNTKSPSTIAGIRPLGLIARYSGALFSPLKFVGTCSKSNCISTAAHKDRKALEPAVP